MTADTRGTAAGAATGAGGGAVGGGGGAGGGGGGGGGGAGAGAGAGVIAHRKVKPRLGSLQRWVRECDAWQGDEQRRRGALRMLDAVLRLNASSSPASSAPVSSSSSASSLAASAASARGERRASPPGEREQGVDRLDHLAVFALGRGRRVPRLSRRLPAVRAAREHTHRRQRRRRERRRAQSEQREHCATELVLRAACGCRRVDRANARRRAKAEGHRQQVQRRILQYIMCEG